MKNRKRITESETRCYISQLIDGVKYIHSRNIVHRDLKLGNLFLDERMQLKIGDFGLSEKIHHEGQKLNSLSGTPNYIAPEILLKESGHSYEVDVWAIGVIAFTLIVGAPPFQAKTSKATCNRIKQVLYSFPSSIKISTQFKDFIRCLLQKEPEKRLKIDKMFEHPFFSLDYPTLCDSSSMFEAPKEYEVSVPFGMDSPQKVATSRAKSLAHIRGTPKTAPKFIEPSDEDIAKDDTEKEDGLYIPSYRTIGKVDLKMETFKRFQSSNFTITPVKEPCIREKPKFMTKMNLTSLQTKYHPTDNVDVPKGEIST